MKVITCPRGNNIETCSFSPRPGAVRDAPEVGLLSCDSCQVIVHDKDLSHLVNYEESSMWDYFGNSTDTMESPKSDLVRRAKALKTLKVSTEKLRLIDVGCSDGTMLGELASDFYVFGVEPEKKRLQETQSKGFKCWQTATEAVSNGELFDVVTMFHVIEHVYDAHTFLREIKQLIKPNGLLVIETPNANDVLLTRYFSSAFAGFTFWSHHPILYSHVALESLVKNAGFQIIENQGVQRYSLDNHLFWLANSKPGGHEIWKELYSQETLESYDRDLIENKVNDTLWLVAKNV